MLLISIRLRVVCLTCIVALLLFATPLSYANHSWQPCAADWQCGATNHICHQNHCLTAHNPCNNDLECASPLACITGQCSLPPVLCEEDKECKADQICAPGGCKNVQCKIDTQCMGSQVCINNECLSCREDAQCGPRQRCQDNSCVTVDCTNDRQCTSQNLCENDTCTARCPQGQRWIEHRGSGIHCGACIDPRTQLRPSFRGDCPPGMLRVGGYCIDNCQSDIPAQQDFDRPAWQQWRK